MEIKLFESKRERERWKMKKQQKECLYTVCVNDIRCRYIDVSLDAHACPEVNYQSVFKWLII